MQFPLTNIWLYNERSAHKLKLLNIFASKTIQNVLHASVYFSSGYRWFATDEILGNHIILRLKHCYLNFICFLLKLMSLNIVNTIRTPFCLALTTVLNITTVKEMTTLLRNALILICFHRLPTNVNNFLWYSVVHVQSK